MATRSGPQGAAATGDRKRRSSKAHSSQREDDSGIVPSRGLRASPLTTSPPRSRLSGESPDGQAVVLDVGRGRHLRVPVPLRVLAHMRAEDRRHHTSARRQEACKTAAKLPVPPADIQVVTLRRPASSASGTGVPFRPNGSAAGSRGCTRSTGGTPAWASIRSCSTAPKVDHGARLVLCGADALGHDGGGQAVGRFYVLSSGHGSIQRPESWRAL